MNTSAPPPVPKEAQARVLGIQRKLHKPVESPVRGNSHAGFGGQPAETERPKGRDRAAG